MDMDFLDLPTTSSLAKELYLCREETGDVTFVVKSERIPAHRCVLAAQSPKYKAQFYGSQRDQGDISVKDISAAAFNEFIKLFYTEKPEFTLDNIEDILSMAKQCLVNRFVVKCKLFLQRKVTKQNVCWIYHLAVLYDLEYVRGLCERLFAENLPEIFSSIDFLDSDHGTLVHILDIEPLNCQESEVFEGCIRWARAECQRKNLDDMQIGKLRAELGDAMTKVRFKSMSLHDFVHLNDKYKQFFSAEEFIEISNIIGGLSKYTSQKFNNASRKANGTATTKYQPLLDTVELLKEGQVKKISTRIHCITVMKDYEHKTIEELRLEDYCANRSHQPSAIFGKPQYFNSDAPIVVSQVTLSPSEQTASVFGVPSGPDNIPSGT